MSLLFPHDVTVAVVTYNALKDDLPRAVSAVVECGCPHDQFMIIDVASTDDTAQWMHTNWPSIRCITLEENRGPNPARNRAILEAKTPYVLVMDVDVELVPGVVQTLRDLFDKDSAIAAVTPAVVYPDKPDTIHQARTYLHYLGEASADYVDRPVASLGTEARDVGSCSGCAPMIRRSAAMDVGMYDEHLFFGKTDGEFAYRLTMAGYRIIETPKARVLHHHHKRGSKYFDHQVANRWYFMLKNYQLRTMLICAPALLVHELSLLMFLIAKGQLRAWWQGVRRLKAMLPSLYASRAQIQSKRVVGDVSLLRGDHMLLPIKKWQARGPVGWVLNIYKTLTHGYWLLARGILRLITTGRHPLESETGVFSSEPSMAMSGPVGTYSANVTSLRGDFASGDSRP